MIVVINMIIGTIANILASFPVYMVPDFKGSRFEMFLRYFMVIFLGSTRYFLEPNTAVDLIIIIASNVIFFVSFIPMLDKKYYKFAIGYVLYAFSSLAGESTAEMLGLNFTNSNIYEKDFGYGCLVIIVIAMVVDSILLLILRNKKHYLDGLEVDRGSVTAIFSLGVYCSFAPIYIYRVIEQEAIPESFARNVIMMANSFTLILLVMIIIRTMTIKRKMYISEYELAQKNEKKRLENLVVQNEYAAKLRHDYINQIAVATRLAEREPEKALELLEDMARRYEKNNLEKNLDDF